MSVSRALRWAWALLAVALVARALQLRTRARALPTLPATAVVPDAPPAWSWLTAPGVAVDPGLAAAVAAHAEGNLEQAEHIYRVVLRADPNQIGVRCG